LKEAIDFYIGGGNSNDYRDKENPPLGFPDRKGTRRPAGIPDVVDGRGPAQRRSAGHVGPKWRPAGGEPRAPHCPGLMNVRMPTEAGK